MGVTYTKNTQALFKEVTTQQKITHYKDDMSLSAQKKRNVRKLYEWDTDKFEPTEENREHLIKTMMPMVLQIAKKHAKCYDSKIEYDDCISAGMLGAVLATDKYIEKAKTSEHTAKLSTYAYYYIEKYIIEHCRNNLTVLSSGPTKVKAATEVGVLSGNRVVNDEGKAVEFFDILGDESIITEVDPVELTEAEKASEMLLNGLSDLQKNILIMSFGLSSTEGALNAKQISKKLKIDSNTVQSLLEETLSTLQEKVANNSNSINILTALKGINFSQTNSWQLKAI